MKMKMKMNTDRESWKWCLVLSAGYLKLKAKNKSMIDPIVLSIISISIIIIDTFGARQAYNKRLIQYNKK